MTTQPDIDEDEDFDPAAVTPAPDLPPSAAQRQWLTPGEGEVWGDFRLGEMLGQGGMGMVFKAHQLSLNRTVALKVLTPYLGQSASFRGRFLREAQSVARIASPHVVQVYAAGSHGDFQFFAMEFVDGEDLGAKLARGYRPSRAETLNIVTQAARGLVAAGEHDIVHRDIKPGNLMVTAKDVVKLMDFGLVRIASDERMTTTGVIMGTPYYFSPEQARGEDCDQRADIYSLGIVFYELLTGELPFTGDANAVVYAHINTRPRRPRELDREIPADWQEVVLTCLAKKPEARYRTASELLRDLERLAADQAPALVAPPRNPWPSRALGAAALVAAATITAYTLRPPEPARTAAAGFPIPQTSRAVAPAATPDAAAAPPVAAATQVPPEEPVIADDGATASAPRETAVTVRAPFRSGRFTSYRWEVGGPRGASGQLDAAVTLLPENVWTAPGRGNGPVTLRVTARTADGRDHVASATLSATDADFPGHRLQPFARWSSIEPTATRPAQDALGRWWGCDTNERRLRRLAVGWLASDAFSYADDGAYVPPLALRVRGEELLALDARRHDLLVFDLGGVAKRRIPTGSPTTADVAVASDGRILLADLERGLRTIGTADPGKAADVCAGHFDRVAVSGDDAVVALDATAGRLHHFAADLAPIDDIAIPLAPDERAVDVAAQGQRLLVLLPSGTVIDIDPGDGKSRRIDRPTMLAPRGPAGSLGIGATGEAIVAWPADGLLSRLPIGGFSEAMRGGKLPRAAAGAADALGRIWTIGDGAALACDQQGWCVARVEATTVGIQRPEQLAVSPDGARLALCGQGAFAIVELDASPLRVRALPAPRSGRWPTAPQLAFDDQRRLYLLDRERRRIWILDESGAVGGFATTNLADPARIAVSRSGGVVYAASADGRTLVKYVFDGGHATIARDADRDPAVPIADLGGRRADALGCDLQGQLYVLDEGRAVRVCSWLTEPATCVAVAALAPVGLPDARSMAVSPDGQVWLGSGDGIAGLRW